MQDTDLQGQARANGRTPNCIAMTVASLLTQQREYMMPVASYQDECASIIRVYCANDIGHFHSIGYARFGMGQVLRFPS